jgi:hypothetical protein
MKLQRNSARCVILASVLMSLLLPSQAHGQDFPALKGTVGRTGTNTSPSTSGPGVGNLVWFKPLPNSGAYRNLIRDNVAPTTGPAPGPVISLTGTWISPTTANGEAAATYIPQASGDATEDVASGRNNYESGATTAYRWAYSIPSTTDVTQPNVKLRAGDQLSTFTWNVEPANPGERSSRSYALYAWLPIGASTDPSTSALVFQQRFFVYDIQYGNGLHVLDVVDTFNAGFGWVRLGGGGKPTQKTFQYDGVNPIKITLYNTVPRDAQGQLTETSDSSGTISPARAVYADAVMAVPQIGFYHSSPIVSAFDPSTGLGTVHVVSAINQVTSATVNGKAVTFTKGIVSSDNPLDGTNRWTISPLDVSGASFSLDNSSAGVTVGASWSSGNAATGFQGPDYLHAPITNDITTATDVVYTPAIRDGSYEVQIYLPGSGGGDIFAQATQYEVHEGTVVSTFVVNQDSNQGWLTLGGRRFLQDNAQGNPLTIHITNYSAQVADAGRNAFTDAVRFTGEENLAINSTPVQVTAGIRTASGGPVVNTAVTLFAAEDGRIYCVDSNGNGHGGTNIYWTYPTLPSISSDPNKVAGLDGPGPIAQMPSGFDLSSALVERVAGTDYLYIAASNGRVYCIDMAGRGDGTTSRVWSYPDDYPAQPLASSLGPITGSLLFANTAAGPTIFVPTPQGRLYALDALPAGNRTTSVRWAFPGGTNSKAAFTTFTSAIRTSSTDTAWNNPDRASVLDQTYATTTPDLNSGGTGFSQYLEALAPKNLFIPPTSTIVGIQVRVVRHRTAGDANLFIHDENIRLIKNGAVQAAADRADTRNDWPTTDQERVYGSIGDLWNNTWTAADINNANFGVAISVKGNGNSGTNTTLPTASIDYVEVRVFYTAQPGLGPIVGTPAAAFGNIYFGTVKKPGDAGGKFFAVNWDTGALSWEFDGTTQWGGGTFTPADDFVAGPAAVSSAQLTADSGSAQVDTVYAANENRWITAFNAANGTILWTTKELGTGVKGNLTYTPMNVFDNTGTNTTSSSPVLTVPTADGRFDGLFALPGTGFGAANRFGTRRAWEYVATGPITSSLAVGRNFMYGADENGYFYAFGNGSSTTSPFAPGVQTQVENDSGVNGSADGYRQAKIKFVNRDTFQQLRTRTISYQQAVQDASREVVRSAFDWGETVYVLVYDFPYDYSPPNVPAPIVNFQFDVEGMSFRNLSVQSQQFPSIPPAPAAHWHNPITDTDIALDGYAVLPFTLQGGGSNALPPGNAEVSVSISTAATTSPPRSVNVALDPTTSKKPFEVANPIALVMKYNGTNPDPNYSIGYSADPSADQNRVNGSPDVAATGEREDLLSATVGTISHGQSGTYSIGVVDRSMMTLLRGPGRGLDNVRVQRSDLSWNGGMAAVPKAIPAAIFPNFEDLPINSPNDSFDYPDIRREQVRVSKDTNGNAENPLYNGVTLNPPSNVDENNPLTRVLEKTQFDLSLDVPKFQPPNQTPNIDSSGANVVAGYRGEYYVFVDSDGNGIMTRDNGRRETYRSFWLVGGVSTDERYHSTTPSVDLGLLAQGAGYSNQTPSDFSPWSGPYAEMFKKFNVTNEGNVNLLNLRVAKRYGQSPNFNDWEIPSNGNSPLAWLDSATNLASDIDANLALTPQVLLQKPRVGDRSGTTLTTNPKRRDNANLGIAAGPLLNGPNDPAPADPRVAVTIPFGFPVGTYSQIMRVIEDPDTNETLELDSNKNATETFTDPSFTLTAHVGETRLTGKPSVNVSPLVDNLVTGTEAFLHANGQPAATRDSRGNLIVAFASTRPSFTAPEPTSADLTKQNKLYVASMHGATPGAALNPLNDLNGFTPKDTNRWFSLDVGPYPTTPTAQLFNGGTVPASAASSVKFSQPAFPPCIIGNNPLGSASTADPYLVFTGEASVSVNSTDLVNESRLFIAHPTVAADGHVTLGDPIPLPDSLQDPTLVGTSQKVRPTILQFGNKATVFYSSAGSGHGQISYATFDGTNWTRNQGFSVPAGFDSISTPSLSARVYNGAGTQNLANGDDIIELALPGKLRGRPHADIFYARIKCTNEGIPVAPTTSNDLSNLALTLQKITDEVLSAEGGGVFRSVGVAWDSSVVPVLKINGVVVLQGNQGQTDPATGIMSFDAAAAGGKVYLDPATGTVRFAGTSPGPRSTVTLTYAPKFLRVSSGSSADSYPTVLYDNRNVGDYAYWATASGTAADQNVAIPSSRYIFTYGAVSSGAGQAARPYLSTYRLGVQLPQPIATNSDGTIQSLTVSGNASNFQVDPARARIYFTDRDEDHAVTITYRDVNGNQQTLDGSGGNPPAPIVSLVHESGESPVAIQQAVNEAQMTTFLDPFNVTPPYTSTNPGRPGLVWMFWTSTRGGAPDLFFQTIAPQLAPVTSTH